MTVGFSSSHDARKMNQIARIGSEWGNFIYVDERLTDGGTYQEKIKKALEESFAIIMESGIPIKFRVYIDVQEIRS